jgi:hypothetical protein
MISIFVIFRLSTMAMQFERSNRDLPLGIDRITIVADISIPICFKILEIFIVLIYFVKNERLDGNIKMVAFDSDFSHPLVGYNVFLKVIPTHLILCYVTLSGLRTCPMPLVNPTLSYGKQIISYIVRINISDLIVFLSSTVTQINDTLDL